MKEDKFDTIVTVYNWTRLVLLILFLLFLFSGVAKAQTVEARLAALENAFEKEKLKQECMPKIHGILRGKYEYQPEMGKSRFEVRNARLSASGRLARSSEYKLEIDLCDESAIKMKDAWVRLTPWKTLRLTMGQQRMSFSIDAHRNPSAQYFANRSFIAKQVGDMRDVGFQLGYDFLSSSGKVPLTLEAGIFNGSNLDNQKDAWFTTPGYTARLLIRPDSRFTIVPSIQHQHIAERKASYTSLDFGAFYENHGWHVEAEYLHKRYASHAFDDCNAVDVMIINKLRLCGGRSYIESISWLGRYDWMQDHSSGKQGFESSNVSQLVKTDAERHRMTLGTTFSLRNNAIPTDIRLNYEKYWYPHGGAKESEQDKLVVELMMKF